MSPQSQDYEVQVVSHGVHFDAAHEYYAPDVVGSTAEVTDSTHSAIGLVALSKEGPI